MKVVYGIIASVIIILIIIIFISLIYLIGNTYGVYIKSPVTNKTYLLKSTGDISKALNIMETLDINIKKIVNKLDETIMNYPRYYKYLLNLTKKINKIKLYENVYNRGTSYNINKGKYIIVCIRSKKDVFYDMNTLMYVIIHEIAHIACPEYGHTSLFKNLNEILLNIAIELNIYTFVDYNMYPVNYCGIILNKTIL